MESDGSTHSATALPNRLRLLVSSDVSGSAVGGHGGSQGDRGGLGSVLRDLVKPGDENLREMNKKLQNMLEEQLTKNMHLQKVTHTHSLYFRWEHT